MNDNNANTGYDFILADSRYTIQLSDYSANTILAGAKDDVKLHPEIRKEWVEKRGFKAKWIEPNIKWMSRANAKKLLGYDPGSDGHWIEGEMGFGQFKPNERYIDKDGKAAKYISPDKETRPYDAITPFYPDVVEFWGGDSNLIRKRAIIKDGVPCVGVTEGNPKAIALSCNVGASVGIPGCWCGTKERPGKNNRPSEEPQYELVETLDYLHRVLGLGLILLLDQDERWSTKDDVYDAIKRLGDTVKGERIWIAQWDPALGKGVDDVIHAHGPGPIQEAIDNALPFDEWLKIYRPRNKKARLRQILDIEYGKRLRFNLLKDEITVDGKTIIAASEARRDGSLTTDWFNFQADCEELLGSEIGDSTFYNAVWSAAKKNAYHPILDYLRHVNEQHKDKPYGAIAQLCDVLGLQTTIERTQMEMHLIASVKRITHPGCKYDTVPVFFGLQGINKTTLWETLYGGKQYFDTLRVGDTDKDTIMLTHKFWAIEYGEIDVIYKKKEIEQVKANLSTTEDTYRPPYERVNRSVPRSFVFVGSTNKPEFLLDDENRRFWMMEPKAEPVIDLEKVREIRDAVWAEAYQKAEAGAKYWFDRGSQDWSEQEAMAKRYTMASPFYEQIITTLPRMPEMFSMTDLCNQMGLTPSDKARFDKAIGKDLRLMGFTNEGYVGHQRLKRWRKSDFIPYPDERHIERHIQNPLKNETLTTSQSERDERDISNFKRLSDLSKEETPVTHHEEEPQPKPETAESEQEPPRKTQNNPLTLSDVEPERVSDSERDNLNPLTPSTPSQQGFEDSERDNAKNMPLKEKKPQIKVDGRWIDNIYSDFLKVGSYVMVWDEYSAYAERLGRIEEICGERATVSWLHKPGQRVHMDLKDLVGAEVGQTKTEYLESVAQYSDISGERKQYQMGEWSSGYYDDKREVRSVLGDFWCDNEYHLTKM